MLPQISVILPVYNGARHLATSIDSVLKQSFTDFEFLILDDASTDASRRIIDSYNDPRIRVMQNAANKGLFPNLNCLINEARSEHVAIWTQDDIMKPECLAEVVSFADRHPEVGMIYYGYDHIDVDGNFISPAPHDPTPEVVPSDLAAQIMAYHGSIAGNISNVTLRKAACKDVGPFREDLRISADFDMWERLSVRYPLGRLPATLIHLRDHKGQLSRAKGSFLIALKEDQEIYARIYQRLPDEVKSHAVRFARRRRYPWYAHQTLRYLITFDLEGAWFLWSTLRGKRFASFAFWLITLNNRRPVIRHRYTEEWRELE